MKKSVTKAVAVKNNTEATLTTTELETAGIKTALNQNDIVEIVANDVYDKTINIVNKAPDYKDLGFFNMTTTTLEKEFKESLKSDPVLSAKFNINESTYFSRSNVNIINILKKHVDHVKCLRKDVDEKTGNVIVELVTREISVPLDKKFTVKYNFKFSVDRSEKETIDDMIIERDTYYVHVSKTDSILNPYSKLSTIESMINKHNEEVQSIYDSIPVSERNGKKYINYKNIEQYVRVNVNKNIIKNQASGVSEQLNKLFGINF